jgi:two-component system sensor histidine kinase HydH
VVFARQVPGEDSRPRVVEIALRKDTVEREEKAPASAIASMFKVSLATVGVAFAFCVLLVAWMMRRETLREAQRRQEEHLAFAGVLANGIVHDFRNPMSSLRLDVQMLQREAAKGGESRLPRMAELAERVRNTIDRMDKVFQEFLYVSHPGSDQREAVDLAACVHDCLSILAPRFENAGVRAEVEPHEPLTVQAHRNSLQRAIVNVLTNAEQFSKKGDAVTIRMRREGLHAILEVLDQGPGVPESQQKQIFDMFVSSRPGGTGLGLFLARTAVERCGGTIRVTNRPEGGACFRIDLPLAEERTGSAV